jgi:hypothetical protein
MKLSNLFRSYRNRKAAKYYTHINELPVFNWFEIQRTNDLKYLFVDYEKNTVAPESFKEILYEMIFQFEKLDISTFKLYADREYFKSLSLTKPTPINKAKFAEADAKIKQLETKKEAEKQLSLSDFVKYIELTFKQIGSLKVKEVSTSYAYSLFYEAQKINSELNRKNSKQHGTI